MTVYLLGVLVGVWIATAAAFAPLVIRVRRAERRARQARQAAAWARARAMEWRV